MTKTLYNHIDKQLISQFPIARYEGRIVIILNESDAAKAVNYILTKPYVGIDTETRPTFRKGQHNKISLLQVCCDNVCFLFRLQRIGNSPSIKRLLENKYVKMIGLSLKDDINSLKAAIDFTPGNFVDIQKLVSNIGIEDMSLQKIFANLFHKKISKSQQLSNWDADVLSEKQQIYGATDAWACIKIYEEYLHLLNTGDYKLEIIPQESHE